MNQRTSLHILCQLSTGLLHFRMRIQTFNENTPLKNLRNQQAPQSLMKNLGELQIVINIQQHLIQWRHVWHDFGCFFNIICWPFHYFTIIYEVIMRCMQSFKVGLSQHGPDCQIVISTVLFRRSDKKFTIKYMQQTEILHKFFKNPRICICDNSGLSSRGNTIGRFLSRNDNTHLSYDGNKIFASNLKSLIRECLGIRLYSRPYKLRI
jgi:hypothetical protein